MPRLCVAIATISSFVGPLLGLLVQQDSWAQSREPVLRLETGTHTGRITVMAVDSTERLLVTAGRTRALLCTLPPP
ncbi:MAG: hypothetical protein ACUVXD_12105 [Thermodesulfobacteriota bacterium]